MIKYVRALDQEEVLRDIVLTLGLNYIDLGRVRVVYSFGANTRAIARIWAIPRVVMEAFNLKPLYVIELVSEKFSKLNNEEKVKVIIHEILHIPLKFSGGLRSHGDKVNEREVNKLYKKYIEIKNRNTS